MKEINLAKYPTLLIAAKGSNIAHVDAFSIRHLKLSCNRNI